MKCPIDADLLAFVMRTAVQELDLYIRESVLCDNVFETLILRVVSGYQMEQSVLGCGGIKRVK